MVVNGQTQGVLSQNGSATIGGSINGSKNINAITVEHPSHVTEYYSPNTLGCTEGLSYEVVYKIRFGTAVILMMCR